MTNDHNSDRLPTISPGKIYRTRDGHKVRIYATNAGGSFPVHGAILHANGKWHHCTFTARGYYSSYTNPKDIISKWGPEIRVDWKVLPAWANYVSQDNNGKWYWFTDKPSFDKKIWDAPGSYRGCIPPTYSVNWNPKGITWHNTLTHRDD